MSITISAQIEGMEPLLKRLAFLPSKIHKKILRDAMAPAARLVTKEVRQVVPVETGTLKKSIGNKSKSYGERAIVFVVGPRKKWGAFVTPAGRTKGQKRVPWRYAHLTEGGTTARTIKTGQRTGSVKAQRWMGQTWNRLKPRVTVMILEKTKEGIAREWIW